MRELVMDLFFMFSFETGILGMVKENQSFLGIALLTLGILACFLGFKIYRLVFSVLVFMTVTITSVFLMRGLTDWGAITTTFAVLGTVMAIFAHRWYKLGGVVISALIGVSIGWIYTYSIWFSILLGISVAVSMLYFPVITLCFMTSLWGAMIIKEFHLNISIIDDGGIIVGSIIVVLGFTVQMLINRKQIIFDKPYPNWVEVRRKEKGRIS